MSGLPLSYSDWGKSCEDSLCSDQHSSPERPDTKKPVLTTLPDIRWYKGGLQELGMALCNFVVGYEVVKTRRQRSNRVQYSAAAHIILPDVSKFFVGCADLFFPLPCCARHAVVGANLCARHTLQVKGMDIGGVGGVAETVHTINIISQRQYFVARCLVSYVGNIFGFHSICVCFPSTRKLAT
jgi:hypothetical protein